MTLLRTVRRAVVPLVLAVCVLLAALPARADGLVVFAAASLTDALRDVGALWQAQGHLALRFSFDASSTLARQIEQGAPADVFASADEKWMDYAQQRKLIVPESRRDLLGNTLVLIAPKSAAQPGGKPGATPREIGPGTDLVALLGPSGRLATGDPASVPVGLYARQALTRLGQWAAIEPRLARAENVRAALLLVSRGEAPLGIVYSTDAAVDRGVVVAGTFAESTHDPITYPFAATSGGDRQRAAAFLAFLAGPAAHEVFARRGFRTAE